MLGAAGDLSVDPELIELLGEVFARLIDVALAFGPLLGDESLDLVVLARVQRLEGEVLELPLDRVDTQAMRDRGVDVERLPGLLDLLLLRHRADRAHVVQPVGELDQDDPDVRRHRDHHLAVVLRLRLVAGLEREAGELGDTVDEAGDVIAERLLDLLERGRGVLDGVMEQRGAQGLGVKPHPRADLRHADGMNDEVLAGLAALIGVVLAGIDERLLHAIPIDDHRSLVGVLLDDREQVAEQPPFTLGELGALDRTVGRRMVDPIDRRPRARDERAAVLRGGGAIGAGSPAVRRRDGRPLAAASDGPGVGGRRRPAGALQALGRGVRVLRNRRPSSYRAA